MVVCVAEKAADSAQQLLRDRGENAYLIGKIVPAEAGQRVEFVQ